MPMLDPTKDPLTLAEIAFHWSRAAGVRYTEREILTYLLQAFWAESVPDQPWDWDEASALDDLYGDDPDVASVARASAPVTAGVNTRSKSIQEEMFGFLGILDRDMAEFIELHGGVPGAVVALAHSNLDRIDKKSMAILRKLTLTKAGLRAFCGGRHFNLPKFWFGEKPAVAEAAPTLPHQESDQPMASEASRLPVEPPTLAQAEEKSLGNDQSPLSRRDQQKAATQAKHDRWYKTSQEIKVDNKPRKSIELARAVKKQEIKAGYTNANAGTIKRCLNRDHRGWAD